MPASIKVYSPLSNIDDSVVAINALLIFPYCKFFFSFKYTMVTSKSSLYIKVKKSLGKKNLGALLSLALTVYL